MGPSVRMAVAYGIIALCMQCGPRSASQEPAVSPIVKQRDRRVSTQVPEAKVDLAPVQWTVLLSCLS
jgi:hypothetical protein